VLFFHLLSRQIGLTMRDEMKAAGATYSETETAVFNLLEDPEMELHPDDIEQIAARVMNDFGVDEEEEDEEATNQPALATLLKPVHTHVEVAEKLGMSPRTAQDAIAVGQALKDLEQSEDPDDQQKADELKRVVEKRGFAPAAKLVQKPAINGRGRELQMVSGSYCTNEPGARQTFCKHIACYGVGGRCQDGTKKPRPRHGTGPDGSENDGV
jgi:hypothetical protein